MRTLLAALVLLSLCFFSGCKTYDYDFSTVINENGAVEREVQFQSNSKQRRLDPETGEQVEVWEPAEFSEDLIIPTGQRFYVHERKEGGFHGKWRSDGVIHTDFRYKLDLPKNAPILQGKGNVRYAYNEGQVIVQDLILVKSITYVERFHDYFSKDELDTNLNAVTDILINLTFAAIKSDLDEKYDLKALENYVRNVIAPFLRRWNSAMFAALGRDEFRILSAEDQWEEFLKIAYDLIKFGVIENLHFDPEELGEDCRTWVIEKMHELIVSRQDGANISTEEAENYLFESDRFAESFNREIEKKYGSAEDFDLLVSALGSTFAFSIFSPDHVFRHSVSVPGSIIHVFPEPTKGEDEGEGDVEDNAGTENEGNTIRWEFSEDRFYPDGVLLTITSVMPLEKNQKLFFKKIVLKDPDGMKDYISLFLSLSKSQRRALLEALRHYMKEGSTEKLEELEWDEKIAEIMEYFEDTDLKPLIEKKGQAIAIEETPAEDLDDENE